MTVKVPITTRAVVTETYSDSSDEEFSSQEDDTQLAHAVDDQVNLIDQSKVSKDSKVASNSDDDADEVDTEQSDNEAAEDADQEEDDDVNSGWADSIAKILNTNKPKKKKTLVLSKAKKLNEPSKAKPRSAGFEVEKEDGVIAEEEIIPEETKEATKSVSNKKKRDIKVLRVKPNILNKDRERLLSKIATKGVVQLFNAVKNQQKDIKTKLDSAGPLEVKRDKVLKSIDKRSFLDHLMGEKGKSVNVAAAEPVKAGGSEKTTWNVLRDDFMMGSNKMKDWDKELDVEDDEEEMEVEQELEIESD